MSDSYGGYPIAGLLTASEMPCTRTRILTFAMLSPAIANEVISLGVTRRKELAGQRQEMT